MKKNIKCKDINTKYIFFNKNEQLIRTLGYKINLNEYFNKFYTHPYYFLQLVAFRAQCLRLSQNLVITSTFKNKYSISIFKQENGFLHSKISSWIKPFIKPIKILHKRDNRVLFNFLNLSELEYYTKEYINYSFIRFKIILDFLTWELKNLFVILQRITRKFKQHGK